MSFSIRAPSRLFIDTTIIIDLTGSLIIHAVTDCLCFVERMLGTVEASVKYAAYRQLCEQKEPKIIQSSHTHILRDNTLCYIFYFFKLYVGNTYNVIDRLSMIKASIFLY